MAGYVHGEARSCLLGPSCLPGGLGRGACGVGLGVKQPFHGAGAGSLRPLSASALSVPPSPPTAQVRAQAVESLAQLAFATSEAYPGPAPGQLSAQTGHVLAVALPKIVEVGAAEGWGPMGVLLCSCLHAWAAARG